MAVDGLAELRAQRSKRTGGRGLPVPQHRKAEPDPPRPETDTGAQGVVEQAVPVVEERVDPAKAPAPVPGPSAGAVTKPDTGPEEVLAPVQRRSRVRATQVHLDPASETHLSELRKRAVLADVDLTQSAVLRLALAELVDRHGYDRIVRMFAEEAPTIRRGRPRH